MKNIVHYCRLFQTGLGLLWTNFLYFADTGEFVGGKFGPVWGRIRPHQAFVGGTHKFFAGGGMWGWGNMED